MLFNDLLDSGDAALDSNLVRGRTVLVKNPSQGGVPDNYRLITCLSVIEKLLTSIIYQKYNFIYNNNNLLLIEHRGCFQYSRGTKDQLSKLVNYV